LEITPDARLVVRAPFRVEESFIRDLLRRKRSWILRKQEDARHRQSRRTFPRQFVGGESLLYLGQSFPLVLRETGLPFFDGESFHVAPRLQDRLREIFIRWYRDQAARFFPQRVAFHAARMGLRFPPVRISGARKRWGSCSPRGKLSFSWRLIMAPPGVIDYVVIHELAHIPVRNHSCQFWNLLESFMPDFKNQKKWLRENGSNLLD
jgi:predicted metal-dependent hydrolase